MSLEIVQLMSMHGPHVCLIVVTVDGLLFRFVRAVVCRGLEMTDQWPLTDQWAGIPSDLRSNESE